MAVKFERHGSRCPQLRHEYKVLRALQKADGFAKVYYYGTQDGFDLLVMDLLGPSLEDEFNKCDRHFSLKTILLIADQMIARMQLMHSRHLLHRDIKPANFVTNGNSGREDVVYSIDFGLSKIYRHPKTKQHIPKTEGGSLMGTPRYASVNNHLGVSQSRRDDLESVAYVLIYFLKGSLPWQGLGGTSPAHKYHLIMEKKRDTPIDVLCKGCPSEFAEFLAYTKSLKFEAGPNYKYCRGMFQELFFALGYSQKDLQEPDWDWNHLDDDK